MYTGKNARRGSCVPNNDARTGENAELRHTY